MHSPTIGGQLLERGLLDEIDLHIAPVLLGDGIRLLDLPGGLAALPPPPRRR
ncbi:dihydrofolate reductase family protein [Nonomuraea ferruginea]